MTMHKNIVIIIIRLHVHPVAFFCAAGSYPTTGTLIIRSFTARTVSWRTRVMAALSFVSRVLSSSAASLFASPLSCERDSYVLLTHSLSFASLQPHASAISFFAWWNLETSWVRKGLENDRRTKGSLYAFLRISLRQDELFQFTEFYEIILSTMSSRKDLLYIELRKKAVAVIAFDALRTLTFG